MDNLNWYVLKCFECTQKTFNIIFRFFIKISLDIKWILLLTTIEMKDLEVNSYLKKNYVKEILLNSITSSLFCEKSEILAK